MANSDKKKKYAADVARRSAELLGDQQSSSAISVEDLSLDFIKYCYEKNERGDALLLATLLEGRYLYVVSPDGKGTWYLWDKHVWQEDVYNSIVNMCEDAAMAYERFAVNMHEDHDAIFQDLIKAGKKPGQATAAIDKIISNYKKRAWKLRGEAGINRAISLAPRITNKEGEAWAIPKIATTASTLDQKKWLLPCQNGVIDLQRGILVPGNPADLMTKSLNIDYDQNADYSFWQKVVDDIAIDPGDPGTTEIPGFLQRLFGYAATGNVNEEALVIFIGPGRNGKGTILESIQNLMGPFFHKANRSLFVEQKYEPPPSATSEHIAALMGKRLVIGAETNKSHKLDLGRVKEITGGGWLNYRKNYGSEQVCQQTHTLILETNELSAGLTSSFSMVQRLVLLDFVFRFVDDIDKEEARSPALKGKFKQKDKGLKEKLLSLEMQQGILRWIVEGCLTWAEHGLQIPDCVLATRDKLSKEEDRIGSMMDEMLVYQPERTNLRMTLADFHTCLDYWWNENIFDTESGGRKCPQKITLSKYLKERGFTVNKKGGKIWVWHFDVKEEYQQIDRFSGITREF